VVVGTRAASRLEVHQPHALRPDQQAVDRSGNDLPAHHCGNSRFGQGRRAEQIGPGGLGQDR
jgi:hypothetical protein